MENISYISFMKETQYPQYFVTEQGDVFSTRRGSMKKLKPQNHKDGYLMIGIWYNYKGKGMLVHRLVAQTFIPNPDNKPQVNHKNGIKTDNRVENLEWSTHKENTNHAFSIGLINMSGENNNNSKLTKEQVIEIRELYSKKTFNQTKLAEMYGVLQPQISYIVNKKYWNHK